MSIPDDDDFFEKLIKSLNGYKEKKIYAWVKSNGDLIDKPSDNYKEILALKDNMQKTVDEEECTLRLIEFNRKETKMKISPPPEPRGKKYAGGSAIGGSIPNTIQDIEKEFKEFFSRQYAGKDVKFWIENNTAYAECGNVRCWVSYSENLGVDVETGLMSKWSAYVTMLKNWNNSYHNVHLGDFYSGTKAVVEAFLAFIRFQVDEQMADI